MARETGNKYSGVEGTIQFNLEALFEIIVDRVDYQHLMDSLPFDMISSVQQKEIHNIKQKDGPAAATKRILEILKVSNKPGKYQALVDALKRDYLILSKALTGHPLPDDSIQKNIIKVFSSNITERMSTIQLLPYLIRSSVIVQLEMEMVDAELRNYGNTRGAQLLLLHLPAHVENWYTEFLKALCDSGQKDLAEFIDESFTLKYITSSNTGVMKTDADAQLYFSRKEDSSDTDLSDDEIPKEVRIKEEKDEDETERKEMNLENTAYVFDSADGSLDDLCAAKPRSIKPEFHGVGKDIHLAISRLKVNNPETSDLQAELNQIVLQHKQQLHNSGKSEILHEEDPSDVFSDDCLLDDDSLLVAGSIIETSCKHLDDSLSERQTPKVNRDSFLDSVASDEKEEVEIPLRKYQEELARPALQGKNVIIMAPTGSGKTRVAFKLIQNHFHRLRYKKYAKVVLLVKDQALANQHGKTCQELLPKYRSQAINGDIKRDKGISLGDCIEKQDILVVTAQLLLNSLMDGEIKSITQFSLLIFDECHHCHDDHAYNKIMQLYRDIKLTPEADTSSLPQVIGLTASVGVGKAKDVVQAKRYILKLMANLDADLISTVTENLDELQQYVVMATPDASGLQVGEEEETIIHVKSRRNDVFRVSITLVMNEIEGMMRNEKVVKNDTVPVDYISVFNAPTVKGSEQYIQWLHNMWNVTATVRDPKVRQFVYPCFKHLMWYNDALIIYNDARVKDAVDYLHEKMNDWKEKPKLDNTEQCLLRLYEACMKPQTIQEVPNPKLDALKETILRSFSEKSVENSRCIVFVKTRNLASALVAWMTDTPELNALNPTAFVGTNATRDKGGLTKCEQGDKLAEFRSGRYKIMVATSVAEEGLDIQQCNLVLRYDHVTHEIAMVQSRGRARAMDSRYCVVAQVGKGTAEKEEINVMREKLMQQAIIELQLDIQQNPQKIRQYLREFQEKDKLDYIVQAKQKEERLIKQGEYELRCIQCNSFICMSSDIRKVQNSHNVVIDPSFRDRVSFTKSTEPKFQSPEIQFIGKIACSSCNEDLGTFCNYRNLELPVIKVCQFIVISQNGEQKKFKKWKKVPFEITQLTNDEITNLLDKLD